FLLATMILWTIPAVGPALSGVLIAWASLQPLVVLRQAYGSNWFSVFIKWSISTGLYFVALVFIITIGFSLSLYNA
ncbi:MAG: hypothetical protein AAFY22_10030, partial [Pseudomonadota bacterium]